MQKSRIRTVALLGALAGLLAVSPDSSAAAECLGRPDALGTSRTLRLDPAQTPRLGSFQYPETLPLNDHEVVLTFDDGPDRVRTGRVLDVLAAECVKATFFVVGRNATAAPQLVRRAYAEGHTIGTHTQTHPYLAKLSFAAAKAEIDGGIASAQAALAEPQALAPFFRPPYLQLTPELERYLAARRLAIWSIDFHARDWFPVSPQEVMTNALDRLQRAGKGVLLLHDIHQRTVTALPALLKELRRRGFRVVHVVPGGPVSAQPKGRAG